MKEILNKYKYYFIILGFIIIGVAIFLYNFFNYKMSHYDSRDQDCLGKTIDTFVFDTEKQQCIKMKMTACQKPIYIDEKECNKLNGLK